MAEQITKPLEKKEEKKMKEVKQEKVEPQVEEKVEAPKTETPKAEVKETKPVVKISKKEEALAKGLGLHASKKHCMYICSFIKNKPIDKAIEDLENVRKFKIAVPFKGEIPHRKGMMSGRYPIKTAGFFITMLKGLKGNVIANQMDLDKTVIVEASASWASRPAKKGGARFKRTNVILKAKEITKEKKK